MARGILVLAFSLAQPETYRPCHRPVRTYKQDIQKKWSHPYNLQPGTGGTSYHTALCEPAYPSPFSPPALHITARFSWMTELLSLKHILTVTHKQLLPAPARPVKERVPGGVCHYSLPSPSFRLRTPHLLFISPFGRYLHWGTEEHSSSGHLPLTGRTTRIPNAKLPVPRVSWTHFPLVSSGVPLRGVLARGWSQAPGTPQMSSPPFWGCSPCRALQTTAK